MRYDLSRVGKLAKAHSLLALIATSIIGIPNSLALEVAPEHPRLFFYSSTLEQVRNRFQQGGSAESIYNLYEHWVQGYFQAGNRSLYYLDDYACIYLLSQDASYGEFAVDIAMEAARNDQQCHNEGNGPARASSVALVYDWCHDLLTEAQKDTIREAFYAHLDWNGIGGYAWQPKDTQWHYMLSIAGDFESPVKNEAVLSKLQESINALDHYFLDCMDSLRPNGAMDGYSWQKLTYLYSFLDCLESVTDYNGPASSSRFLQAGPIHWMHRMRPDYAALRTPGKYNPGFRPASHMAYFSSRFGFEYGQTVADELILRMTNASMPTYGRDLMFSYEPNLPSLPLNQLSLDYADSTMGFIISRSDWSIGDQSTSVIVSFFNSPDTEYRQANAQNHFTVSRGADNLVIDSGRYGVDNDFGFQAYYKRTIAHNTVLVYDQSEHFGTMRNSYGHTLPLPNDGGQQVFDVSCNGTGNHWPECVVSGNPGVACRGSITYYETTPERMLVESDATPAYWSEKVTKAVRRVAYQRPNWLLIQDELVLAKPDLPVRIVYHCVDRPSVNGSVVTMAGDINHGGVFESEDTDRITIDSGRSSARLHLLDVSSGTGKVRVIGGASVLGEHWKQSLESQDEYSYVANAELQSYEFYVEGFNYPPGGRDETYLREHRNDGGPDQAGDWRIEQLIEGVQDTVIVTTLIHVTEKDAPLALIEAETDSNGELYVIGVDGSSRIRAVVRRRGGGDPVLLYPQ